MYYAIWQGDWGWQGALGNEEGLAYLVLPKKDRETVWNHLKKYALTDCLEENPAHFSSLQQELTRYFQGEPFEFREFTLQWKRVTPYRRKVLQKTMEIPYGETRTYKWLAEAVGNPRGSRSVGQAMAHNPWPILIPCHRVLGSNGKLTGFGGGVELKRRMLALEGCLVKP